MYERKTHDDVETADAVKSAEQPIARRRDDSTAWSAIPLGEALVQAKLSVGPAGDRYEREADAVATRVVRALRTEPSSDASTSASVPPVQRIQRASHIGAAGGEVDADTEVAVRSAVGRGAPLSSDLRSRLEPAFGADLSRVRVHQGAQSAELNNRIQAKAFTTGDDIFFRDGLPNTSTADGQHLLAHELTHTIQQRGVGGQVALQRKKGSGGGGKKGGGKKGGGKKGGGQKGGGAQGGAQRQAPPKKELTEEELAARAEKQRLAAEAAAAKKAEEERIAAEQEAARLAAEEAERKLRVARGRSVWNGLTSRLWATVPAEVRAQKGPDGKVVFTKAPTVAMMAAAFADLKLMLETGAFHPDDTDEELLGDEAEIDETWDEHLWEQVGVKLGSQVATKTALFAHLGWPTVRGVAWDLKACGRAPSGEKVHITLSGNSMLAPQTIVGADPNALERSPERVFDALFMIAESNNRVHCTRESKPAKHLYLGGRNGLGMLIADTDWDGDAKFMREQLDAFRAGAIEKIIAAKAKGWKI